VPGRQLDGPIKGSLCACGVSMIVDRRVAICRWLTRPVFKALVGIASSWIQNGQAGKRRKVHEEGSLVSRRRNSMYFIAITNGPSANGAFFNSIVQRHDQNGTFCSLQNPVDDAARKEMIKKTVVVRAENNQIYTIILCLSQNQFDRGPLEFQLG